ncbi:MAG: hypothetical protein AAFX78_03280 [Cyanobacteria bacterium J06638_20]
MAGLFGLFGGNKNPDGTPKQKEEAYFLDSDSAKTFGDINYMRSSKTITHKFPKTFSNRGEFEKAETVSAMDKMQGSDAPVTPSLENGSTDQWQPTSMNGMSNNGSSSTSFSSGSSSKEEERKADSSLDMFRSMAREIRKR